MSKNAIKVSELNSYIKKLVDMDYLLKNINVIGEISNLKKHSNGNIYFSLKDEKARINAIVYGSKIDFDFNLEEGLSIIATGVVSLYEKEGQINFYVDDIEINGEGNLYRDFLNFVLIYRSYYLYFFQEGIGYKDLENHFLLLNHLN